MAKSKFEKVLERMFQQDFVRDTQKNHLYRLKINRNGYFCIEQNRYRNGVVIEPYIKQWEFLHLDAAIAKLNEIKTGLAKWEPISSETKLLYQRFG